MRETRLLQPRGGLKAILTLGQHSTYGRMSSRLFVVGLQRLRYLGLPTRVVNTLWDAFYIRTGVHVG